ncbi:MAG: EpsD family peptidyl-prolyl cis-trans isomerase [Gallionella sp.]
MTDFKAWSFVKTEKSVPCRWLLAGVLMLVAAVAMTACGSKNKQGGQSLARVNGEDITILQLNDELNRANVPPAQQEIARNKLLETLIDRQLLVEEAMRDKLDRSPAVLANIEHAKAQIIAQAYIQQIMGKIQRPSRVEIDDYYQKHPELFAHRKQFDMKFLAIASKDMSDGLKSAMASANSLDSIEAWLVKNGVTYKAGQGSRDSSQLPEEVAVRLQSMSKGKLFVINEGGTNLIVAIADMKDDPVSAADAEPRIVQILVEKKKKEIFDTEMTHLRQMAKIEYLGASAPVPAPALAASQAGQAASAVGSH